MDETELGALLDDLRTQPSEGEWFEFKGNKAKPDDIGEYISALSNGATLNGPLVEVFADRIEITNPGIPLINTLRFIDEPPQSRNEVMAALLRRLNMCEERGSGIDKVVFQVELFQLPAPEFQVTENHTRAILFAYKPLKDMSKEDKIRACYQHACLCLVSN